jgi:Tol biopolymer transport system component
LPVNIWVSQIKYLTEGDVLMAKKSPKIYISLGITVLILATLACGSVQVGVITPTTEDVGVETPVAIIMEQTSVSSPPTPVSSPETEVEPAATTAVPESSIPTLAYIGPDYNVWVLEAGSNTARQVTFDANLIGDEGAAVEYGSLSLSSDGTLLAYRLDVGTPSASGYDFTHSLWVANLTTGEQRQIMDGRPSGPAWKPGTHLLAYGTVVDMNYFISRPDPTLATGIRAIDLDSGEILELVAPERGYALSGPKWSSDGRFLAFTEVFNMEGSGLFAYYDLEGQEYVAWDEPVGLVSWSPNGNLLTYARHTYAATGEERLYMRPRKGSEQLLGPDYDGPAYATHPIFSPPGNQIAYLAFLEGPMTEIATIMVLDLASGEPKSLGQFEDVWELAWVPDGSHVVFSFGPYPSRQIVALNISDGSQTVLAAGDQLSLAGQ